jgi:type II secretory pathway pseudopilin PulG
MAAAAAMVIAALRRRSNAAEKNRQVTRRVAATENFIEVASSANDGPWGTGESFASYCAHSRGKLSEALLFGEMQQL